MIWVTFAKQTSCLIFFGPDTTHLNQRAFTEAISINADFFSAHNFGGDWLEKGFEWNGNMNFKNYWTCMDRR